LALLERGADVAATHRLDVGPEPQRLLADPPLDLLVEADKRAAADKENVGRVDLEEFLMRVLAAALRRHVRHRPFENLEQGLLDAFARDVARNRRVLVLATDFVDLVDVDDSLLSSLDIAIRGLRSLRMMFSTSSPTYPASVSVVVGDRNGTLRCARALSQQRLAGACRTDRKIFDFWISRRYTVSPSRSACMLIDGDSQFLLHIFLTDYVFVEELTIRLA
jgi:hypothetical protein